MTTPSHTDPQLRERINSLTNAPQSEAKSKEDCMNDSVSNDATDLKATNERRSSTDGPHITAPTDGGEIISNSAILQLAKHLGMIATTHQTHGGLLQ